MSATVGAAFTTAFADADAGRLVEALEGLKAGLEVEPDNLASRTRLGLIQRSLGDLEAALASFERVHAAAPCADHARLNLALALDEAGLQARSLALLDDARELLAASPRARAMAAPVLLRAGDYRRGFSYYEARWDIDDPYQKMRDYPQPLWRGEAGHGQVLLLWHEQGLGDTLLGIRFAGAASARGWHVIADVQPALRRLLAGVPGVGSICAADAGAERFDVHAPLLSLPALLRTGPADAGDSVPYLAAPAALAQKWRTLLPPSDKFRIGMAWRSSVFRDDLLATKSKLDRSMPLAALRPFGGLRGVELVSLQVAEGADETAAVKGMRLTDHTARIDDMADTAALIAQLDLVVSIDTSVAHLAGAMGKPLLVLQKCDPDWRWLAGTLASPWYRQALTFHQATRGDWRAAVAAACATARRLAAARQPQPWWRRWIGGTQ